MDRKKIIKIPINDRPPIVGHRFVPAMDQYLRLPPPYVLYAIFASIGGFIFG